MKKMSKFMVGLLLSTVLIMTVLGCENPAGGGSEEETNPILGTWVATSGTKVREYNFTETILTITENDISSNANVMSLAGERTGSLTPKVIYKGSYTVDSSNAEKITFSYKITASEDTVETTFYFTTVTTGAKTFTIKIKTIDKDGKETTEELTGNDIPGVAKLENLLGTWEATFDVSIPTIEGMDPIVLKSEIYQTFTATNIISYMNMEIPLAIEVGTWTPKTTVSYTFDDLILSIVDLTGNAVDFTFNKEKTSLTIKLPSDLIPPEAGGASFPTSVVYTKISDYTFPQHSLLGKWKAGTGGEYVFTENTFKTPESSEEMNFISVSEVTTAGILLTTATVSYIDSQNPVSIGFKFTDLTKTKFNILNVDGTMGAETYTKQ